ncbi:regulatory protein, luxR family [Agreia bicolorata]|uniref:Regulatory protein, luxR family n=1 Tax=Agreia bicolorata TaxID=110935 RepID=A0A1T4XLY6_9MICO|nr:regulatory protein, luxR family [Agreia bicolorata]
MTSLVATEPHIVSTADSADAGHRPYPADRDRFLTLLDRWIVVDSSGGALVTAPDAADAASLVRTFALRHPEWRSIRPASLAKGLPPLIDGVRAFAEAWEKALRIGQEHPLVVLVDTADPSTRPHLALMEFFGRRSAGTRITLLFSATDADERLREIGLPTIVLPANDVPVQGIWQPTRTPADDGSVRLHASAIDALPLGARRLLSAIAVLGEAEIDIALTAADNAELSDLDLLELAGMVTVDVERVRILDEDLRSQVYFTLAPDERRAAHRRAAKALELAGDSDLQAWQWSAAAAGPDQVAADALLASVDQARRRGGPASESLLIERAAQLTEKTGQRGSLLVRAGLAAWRAGLDRRAQRLLALAEPVDDPEARATAIFVAGALAQRSADPDDAFDLLVSATEAASSESPGLAIDLTSRVAGVAWWSGRLDWAEAAVHLSKRIEPTAVSSIDRFVADSIPAGLRILQHDFTAIPDVLTALDAVSGLEGRQLVFASEVAGLIGDDERALSLQGAAITSIREGGSSSELPFALELFAFVNAWHGQLDAAAVAADQALELAEKYGERRRGPFQYAVLAHVAALRGDEVDCRRFAADALSGSPDANPATVRWALGRLELSLGRSADAFRELSEIYSGPAQHPLTVLYAAPDYVEAAVDAGHLESAEKVAELFDRWAEAGSPWGRAVMPRLRGLLADDVQAVGHFERSLQPDNGLLRPYDRARTQLLLGRRLRKMRRRIDSREHFRAATASFTQLGMDAWAAQARAELRASGEAATSTRIETLNGLTAQEVQVAELVATGVSNRDVAAELHLSPRTVEYHLAKVYVKLGISSRTQLSAALGAG